MEKGTPEHEDLWRRYEAIRAEQAAIVGREDAYRKSATEFAIFGLRSLVTISAGATGLLAGFRSQGDLVNALATAILPYTASATGLAILAAGLGYISLDAKAVAVSQVALSSYTPTQRQRVKSDREYYLSIAGWFTRAAVVVALAALALLTVPAVHQLWNLDPVAKGAETAHF